MLFACIGLIQIEHFPVQMQVLASTTKFAASCHLTGGLFCLLNITFNYVGCVTTDPGSTQILDKPVSCLALMQDHSSTDPPLP